jgi:hypothetical protein
MYWYYEAEFSLSRGGNTFWTASIISMLTLSVFSISTHMFSMGLLTRRVVETVDVIFLVRRVSGIGFDGRVHLVG